MGPTRSSCVGSVELQRAPSAALRTEEAETFLSSTLTLQLIPVPGADIQSCGSCGCWGDNKAANAEPSLAQPTQPPLIVAGPGEAPGTPQLAPPAFIVGDSAKILGPETTASTTFPYRGGALVTEETPAVPGDTGCYPWSR